MAAKIRRLAKGVATTTSTSIYRATTRTVIRTIDLLAGDVTVFGIGAANAASPVSAGVFLATSGGSGGYEGYRGAVVLEPGEQVFVDTVSGTTSFIMCGVTGVS